jgi:hypothetical protein
MEQATQAVPTQEARPSARPPAARSGHDVGDAGTGRDGEDQRGDEEGKRRKHGMKVNGAGGVAAESASRPIAQRPFVCR